MVVSNGITMPTPSSVTADQLFQKFKWGHTHRHHGDFKNLPFFLFRTYKRYKENNLYLLEICIVYFKYQY